MDHFLRRQAGHRRDPCFGAATAPRLPAKPERHPVLSGPTQSDDGAEAIGSLFVINVNSRAEAKAFSDGDPFTQNGVFKSITITRMRKGQWNPGAAEGA